MQQANLLTLLQVIGGRDVELDLKQIAAIYLKNSIKRQWYSGVLDASLKPPMTSQLLQLVPAVPAAVQDQLLECLRVSIQEHTSPDVVNQIVMWLKAGNSGETVMAALKVMRIVARKYEYRDGGALFVTVVHSSAIETCLASANHVLAACCIVHTPHSLFLPLHVL